MSNKNINKYVISLWIDALGGIATVMDQSLRVAYHQVYNFFILSCNIIKKIFNYIINNIIYLIINLQTLTEFLQIVNQATTVWNSGSVEKCQTLIKSALGITFVPIALLSTKHNDIVSTTIYYSYKVNHSQDTELHLKYDYSLWI